MSVFVDFTSYMNGIFYIYLEYFNKENTFLGVKRLYMRYDDEKLNPQIYEKMAKECLVEPPKKELEEIKKHVNNNPVIN